jgi:periplasmic divalent cation tolerance protein
MADEKLQNLSACQSSVLCFLSSVFCHLFSVFCNLTSENEGNPMSVNFIYMTASSKAEAQKIGKALVDSRLAACVNILDNMQSIYRWEEKIQEDSEVVLIAKTTETLVPRLIDKVKSLHSYDCPCIVSLPVLGGYPPFLDWIKTEVEK